MMKKFLLLLMIAAGFSFVACSDDASYDADSAVSNYEPLTGSRMVASVYTKNILGGREYTFKHNFQYDVHGRIKEVNSVIKHHREYSQIVTGEALYRACDITSNAKYFYDNDVLRIAYRVDRRYPDYPTWDYGYAYEDVARLNRDGYIVNYNDGSMGVGSECVYVLNTLKNVAYDGGYTIDIYRDGGNVNGYKYTGYDQNNNDSVSVKAGLYKYTRVENKTNFDFSAYLGYWENERHIFELSFWPYAPFQLAAFGFFGSCSKYLPLCIAAEGEGVSTNDLWEFDADGFPVKYTDPTGRVTEIEYVE